MKAMILAAGRGARMRPLTDTVPKPLLRVGDRSLIEHQIARLVDAGFRDLVINHSYLGEAIEAALGDGSRYGARILYSPEPGGALETAGGVRQALPLLGEAFLVVNGDVWTDYPFARLARAPARLAHLVLVDNPPHNPRGDFALDDGTVRETGDSCLTFAGIGVYRAALFARVPEGRFALSTLLRGAMQSGDVSGEHYRGVWDDIGTPQRLQALANSLAHRR